MSETAEDLIANARTDFSGFFKWADVLNGMIQDQVGPQFGLVVSQPEVDLATGKVSGALEVSRPMKAALTIPFDIQGKQITFAHDKFYLADKASGSKITKFSSESIHDINRILGDIVQNYIG
ncbi:hypothetical protein [Beijerinckia indica]|uniref:Uncharacterized protein n=1 Tax=Beijerinckia indica subsp. indica (strain ATCC 9039 / DSM 1715 / NCIMB 8712) TaxID=395963 RepID=B2IF69_BEII9|nr:hypothetical protein [Beijerinckia indica]ACB95634.1 hypothetical protein Bind_2012 [Beijerinckia indica subsp. indica ATCC 9039]